jgi:hypothetical protein
MIEFKVITKNALTGKETTDYELFRSVEAAEAYSDMHPNATVDFESAIDWAHTETKYEYDEA